MLMFLRDAWQTMQLRARYQRLVQERLLALTEQGPACSEAPDPGGWSPLGSLGCGPGSRSRTDVLRHARRLAATNPYARHLLRLMEIYVAGPGLQVTAAAVDPERIDERLQRDADRCWDEFLRANRCHFSFCETARRTWRDGECFVRLFAQPSWPPTVRYVDPEVIGSTADAAASQGLLVDSEDIEDVLAYQRIHPADGSPVEEIPAAEMLHIKVGCDSNEPRGMSIFAPLIDLLARFERWQETELQARQLQASIVLWRRVQGSPTQVTAFGESQGESTRFGRRERYRPGTILTTSPGTDLQFLQPQTNFGDAMPLGRLLLLGIAAGVGVPEFMLTSDASNANYASTMVAEGPAVKLFESEQHFFARQLERLWWWVIGEAVATGRLPADAIANLRPQWTFPQLVNRNRSQERRTDAELVRSGILSRAEVARRDNVDPTVMQAEMRCEEGREGRGLRAEGRGPEKATDDHGFFST